MIVKFKDMARTSQEKASDLEEEEVHRLMLCFIGKEERKKVQTQKQTVEREREEDVQEPNSIH